MKAKWKNNMNGNEKREWIAAMYEILDFEPVGLSRHWKRAAIQEIEVALQAAYDEGREDGYDAGYDDYLAVKYW